MSTLTGVCCPKKFTFLWYLKDLGQFVKRHLLHTFRDPDQVSAIIIQPIMYTVMFRYLFGGAIAVDDGISYINFFMAGSLIMNTIFGTTVVCLGVAQELNEGIFDRFRSLPVAKSAILGSHVVASVIRSAFVMLVVIVVSLAVGFHSQASPIAWLCVCGIVFLTSFATSWFMVMLALWSKSVEAAQQFAFIFIFPLTMVSSAIIPTSTMPSFLRVIAENQPYTHAIEAIRALLLGKMVGSHIWIAAFWLTLITILSASLSMYAFHKLNR